MRRSLFAKRSSATSCGPPDGPAASTVQSTRSWGCRPLPSLSENSFVRIVSTVVKQTCEGLQPPNSGCPSITLRSEMCRPVAVEAGTGWYPLGSSSSSSEVGLSRSCTQKPDRRPSSSQVVCPCLSCPRSGAAVASTDTAAHPTKNPRRMRGSERGDVGSAGARAPNGGTEVGVVLGIQGVEPHVAVADLAVRSDHVHHPSEVARLVVGRVALGNVL